MLDDRAHIEETNIPEGVNESFRKLIQTFPSLNQITKKNVIRLSWNIVGKKLRYTMRSSVPSA